MSNVSFDGEEVHGGTSSEDLVVESEYVVVDADQVQRQEVLHRTEHVKHDGSEMMLTKSWTSDTMWPGRKPKHVMDIWEENKNTKRRFVFWEGLG